MDEEASEAMGINITYYKILAFGQGALLAGFAGALYAHLTAYISPSDFDYHRAVEILIFAIFGGSEVIWGPIFGAIFLSTMPEVFTCYQRISLHDLRCTTCTYDGIPSARAY